MYFDVPKISISPPPPEEPTIEPYSPFTSIPSPVIPDNDGFRPSHLTPPPTVHHFKQGTRKTNSDEVCGIGLESERFQELLKATRERTTSVGLRKELALKIQKNKQAERRALFLSKVQAPPSPAATMTPKTPPESPAVFHYSLPSPGLESPLAVFESIDKDSCEGWVEHMHFDKPAVAPEKRRLTRLPSLDQISARMIPSTVNPSDYDVDVLDSRSNIRNKTRPLVGVGRLRMPLRGSQPQIQANTFPPHLLQPPVSVTQNSATIKVVSNTAINSEYSSPHDTNNLTETNLNAFNIRGKRAHDMLCTLRRRTLSFPTKSQFLFDAELDDDKCKRHSAPAEMTTHARVGFVHPVLAMPGGF